MKKNILLLVGIVLLGLILRFYQLGNVPLSLNWDEVSIGYNSYSVLKTGKDEYGKLLPLTFKSFGDYKQPGYIYLSVPSVALFGLNSFGVRFPSAILGTLTILSVYFLVKEILIKYRWKEEIVLLTGLLFALSPWSIQFSRFASEANVALFFMLTGAWLFLRATRLGSNLALFLSGFFLLFSMYTYHSQKLFTPFLLMLLLIYKLEYIWKRKTLLIVFLLIFGLGNLPWLIDSATTERGRSVLFTSEQTQLLEEPIKLSNEDKAHNDLFGSLQHNRRMVYFDVYVQNYLSHFDPNFLFINGDNARHHAPDMGVLYLVSLPFIIVGLFSLWKQSARQALFLTVWLLAAPGVSALAINAPNAIRSMMFLPLWQLFAAVGIVSSVIFLKSSFLRKLILLIVIVLYSLNGLYYLHQYFSHTNKEYGRYWQEGYQQVVEQSKTLTDMPVVFMPDIEQAPTFYLYYAKIDPRAYLNNGGSNNRQKDCFVINNAYFGSCLEEVKHGYLITSKNPPTNLEADIVNSISYKSGEKAITIYRYQQK